MTFVLYLYRRFFPVFIGALSFFAMVLILVDLLMNLWQYISNGVSLSQILRVLLLYFPKTLSFALPLAILFAASYVLSDLYAKNELTVIFASGVSLFQFTLPLLVIALLLSYVLFIFEDKIVVPSYAEKTRLQNKLLGQSKSLDNNNIVIIADEGRIVYKAEFYDETQQSLKQPVIVFRNTDTSLKAVICGDEARWNGSNWELSNAVQYIVYKKTVCFSSVPHIKLVQTLSEPPETFRNNTVSVEEVNIKEARTYIDHLRRAGLPSAEARSQYYKKYSFPFIVFIVVFLSVGLSGKSRKNVLLVSLISSISAAVLFYVSQMVTMLLAQFGYVSPIIGAWAPIILFIFLSILLLRFART